MRTERGGLETLGQLRELRAPPDLPCLSFPTCKTGCVQGISMTEGMSLLCCTLRPRARQGREGTWHLLTRTPFWRNRDAGAEATAAQESHSGGPTGTGRVKPRGSPGGDPALPPLPPPPNSDAPQVSSPKGPCGSGDGEKPGRHVQHLGLLGPGHPCCLGAPRPSSRGRGAAAASSRRRGGNRSSPVPRATSRAARRPSSSQEEPQGGDPAEQTLLSHGQE